MFELLFGAFYTQLALDVVMAGDFNEEKCEACERRTTCLLYKYATKMNTQKEHFKEN